MNQQFESSSAAGASPRRPAKLPQTTRQIVLASRPETMPTEANFALEVAALRPPEREEVIVRTLYLSMDPYLRAKMREAPTFGAPFELNKPLASAGIGEVVESNSPLFRKRNKVLGMLEWADYPVVPAKGLRLLDPKAAPLTAHLSVLGMNGLTAYFGMLEIAVPRKGETAVVSAAAGAVGSVAGQLAKLEGSRVVGIVGSEAKAGFLLDELGFDAAIDYKTQDVAQALSQACPGGIDVYYDNVGGNITDAALACIRDHARIVICGQISTYNQKGPDVGPRPYLQLLAHSALMKGFNVYDYEKRHPEALRQLARWIKAGKIKYRETIVEGLENAPKAFIGLFKGENIGKLLVRV